MVGFPVKFKTNFLSFNNHNVFLYLSELTVIAQEVD